MVGRRKLADILNLQEEERGEYGGNFLELGIMSFDGAFFVNVVLKGNTGEIKGLREIVEFRNSIDDASFTYCTWPDRISGERTLLKPLQKL